MSYNSRNASSELFGNNASPRLFGSSQNASTGLFGNNNQDASYGPYRVSGDTSGSLWGDGQGLSAETGSVRGFGDPIVYGTPAGFGEPRRPSRTESTSWHGGFRHSRRAQERQRRPGGAFSRPTRRTHSANPRQLALPQNQTTRPQPPRRNDTFNTCFINGVRVTSELVNLIVDLFDDGVDCDDICEVAATRFSGDARPDGLHFDPEVVIAALTMAGRFVIFEDDGTMYRWRADEETHVARGIGEGIMMYRREPDRDGLPVIVTEMEGRSGLLPGFFDHCFRQP